MEVRHRLFLACRLNQSLAANLHSWAETNLRGQPVRLVPICQLHVTLMFFGDVSPDVKLELATLLSEATWAPIRVALSSFKCYGHNALAVSLEISPEDSFEIDSRLGRCFAPLPMPCDQEALNRLFRRDDPLVKMSRHITKDDLEKKRRRNHLSKPLDLHLTVARVNKGKSVDASSFQVPKLQFDLAEPVLFESFLRPDGVDHQIIAYCGSSDLES